MVFCSYDLTDIWTSKTEVSKALEVGDKKLLQGRARMEVSYSHPVHLKQLDSENLSNSQDGKI